MQDENDKSEVTAEVSLDSSAEEDSVTANDSSTLPQTSSSIVEPSSTIPPRSTASGSKTPGPGMQSATVASNQSSIMKEESPASVKPVINDSVTNGTETERRKSSSSDDKGAAAGNSALDQIKAWSVNKIVCTRQLLSEKFGRASKTVDSDLEDMIFITRDTQRKLEEMLEQARSMAVNFTFFVQNQRDLATTFREMAQKMPEMNGEFECNADTQKMTVQRGDVLIGDLNFFTSNVATLCGKTIEDTLLTIKQYESARLEYDAHRTSYEADAKNAQKAEEALRQFNVHKEKFELLRDAVYMKIRLLNQNKLKVMRKQLFLLHCSMVAYFTQDHDALLEAKQKFDEIKSSATTPSLFDDAM